MGLYFLLPILLALFIVWLWLWFVLRAFSLYITKLKCPGKRILQDYSMMSIHFAPVPYFKESNDSEELKQAIQQRNWRVLWYWVLFVLIMTICYYANKAENEAIRKREQRELALQTRRLNSAPKYHSGAFRLDCCCGDLVYTIQDTSVSNSSKLIDSLNIRNKAAFSALSLVKESIIAYQGLFLKKAVYFGDSVELCFLKRVDPLEVDSQAKEVIDNGLNICFNSAVDSLNLFNNYAQLLVRLPSSKFISIDNDAFTEYDIVGLYKIDDNILIHVYIKASSGIAANYVHIYPLKMPNQRECKLYQGMDKKVQSLIWVN